MRKIAIFFILILVIAGIKLYSQDVPYYDPFTPLIPMEAETDASGRIKEDAIPPLAIEGVLWDSDLSQAIISGEVYKVGDTLKGIDAKVIRIEKNTVFISFKNKIFEFATNKKEITKEKETKKEEQK
ncbi:MAG: hypothetical protein KBB01_02120 [Candidatus Omnitrophica bacterium]|jgi:hypothetical protein|nr:hypothetical protein [Candidatus Omnitrophota bacterium]